MRSIFTILLFISLGTRAFATEPDYALRVDGESVDIQAARGQKITLVTAKLFYKIDEGVLIPSNETYVLSVLDGSYPKIVDVLEGHSVSFQLADLDEIEGSELLAYYFAGGNQFAVKLYRVKGTDITPLRTQPGRSNMRSIRIDGKKIIVENEERISRNKALVLIDSYAVIDGNCKFLGEQKRAVRKLERSHKPKEEESNPDN